MNIKIINKADNVLSLSDEMTIEQAISIIASVEDKNMMLDHVHDDIFPIEMFEFTFTVKDFLDHIGYSENRIEVNYMTGLLLLIFENVVHEFDLKDGDVGEFWHGFEHNGESKDLNFHVNDDLIASASVYGTTKNDDGTVSCNTNDETYIENKFVREVGNVKEYMGITDEVVKPKTNLTSKQRLDYARKALNNRGIETSILSGINGTTLYVNINENDLALSDAEIDFQAEEYVAYLDENCE